VRGARARLKRNPARRVPAGAIRPIAFRQVSDLLIRVNHYRARRAVTGSSASAARFLRDSIGRRSSVAAEARLKRKARGGDGGRNSSYRISPSKPSADSCQALL
jgi:hypothetical protein